MKGFTKLSAIACLVLGNSATAEETGFERHTTGFTGNTTKYPIRYVTVPSGTNYSIRIVKLDTSTNYTIRLLEK